MSRLPRPFATLSPGPQALTFIQGDALDVLASLDAGSVSVVVTSPPYNLGIRYRSFSDDQPRADYLEWTGRWVAEVARVLAPDGSLFLNVGGKPSDPWIPFEVAQAARAYLQLQNVIHWVKSIAIDHEAAGRGSGLSRDIALGHYKPINSDRFINDCHEYVFHFSPAGRTPLDRLAIGVPYQDKSNVARWAGTGRDVRCRGNTWFIPYETIQSRDRERPHPATFPVRLPEQCLRLHGVDRIRLVVDPFLGLGSSAVAAARAGVAFLGGDLDAAYLADAVARARDALAIRDDSISFS
jgi:site-specific DNA-methyltransferase (adenine-specific)